MKKMDVLEVSWRDAIRLCYSVAEKILASGFEPEVVVAVLRGGAVAAVIVSDYLGVEELCAVRVKHWGVGSRKYEEPVVVQAPPRSLVEGRRVLVVDEVVDTGLTLEKVVNELKSMGASTIKTAALHVKPTAKVLPDYYGEKLDEWKWILYPWSVVETVVSLALKEGASSVEQVVERAKEIVKRVVLQGIAEETVIKGVERMASNILAGHADQT